MSVLLYGIAERGDAPIDGLGLQQQPLRGVYAGQLVAIISDHPCTAPRPEHETLWEYERIVESIGGIDAAVPARFGSVMDDDEAVLDLLRSRSDHLMTVLGRTRGAVELAVRARWVAPSERKPETGTGYMRARLQLRSRAREVAGELTPLGTLSRASRCELPAGPEQPMRCAFLVDRELVDDFTESVRRLDHQLSDVELACTGPWPPYSFAEAVPA